MLFQELRRRVAPAVSDIGASIEHVGSTAVPGLAAKPIIDMDVVVPAVSDVSLAISRLRAIGYTDQGDLGVSGRQALGPPLDSPYHHLYVVVDGNQAHCDHVDLRDYLRRHPDEAHRYGARKRGIAFLLETNRSLYGLSKSDLVQEFSRRARTRS